MMPIKRILFISIPVLCFFLFIVFSIYSLSDNISFYKTPSEILKKSDSFLTKKLRVGGYIVSGSLKKTKENIKFIITDSNSEMLVSYSGKLPPMFAEGSGVIATGLFSKDNIFYADELLSKHDEKYYSKGIKNAKQKN